MKEQESRPFSNERKKPGQGLKIALLMALYKRNKFLATLVGGLFVK